MWCFYFVLKVISIKFFAEIAQSLCINSAMAFLWQTFNIVPIHGKKLHSYRVLKKRKKKKITYRWVGSVLKRRREGERGREDV